MIVVVGNPSWRPAPPAGPAGRPAAIALAAAAAGSQVELVGRAGDDDAGDRLLIALSGAGVGHVALLRDPARATPLEAAPSVAAEPGSDDDPDAAARSVLEVDTVDDGEPEAGRGVEYAGPVLEAADVAMGLRYLTDFAVLVLVDGAPASALPVVVDAAAYAGAHLVVLVPEEAPLPEGLPADATALAVPALDPDGAFARLVGAYAAALDRGEEPSGAFRAAIGGQGWEPA